MRYVLRLITRGIPSSPQVALDYLDMVHETHPFDLTLFNIRDPPKDADPMEANKWKRMYQYDIVSARERPPSPWLSTD